METQEIINYCNAFNQKASQYKESIQEAEKQTEGILDELGIVVFTGE
jgi:DNA-directed RNA polymerase subunit N (RpoN/RPB10)